MKERVSVIGWKLLLFLLVIGLGLIFFGFYIMVLGGLQVGVLFLILGAVSLIILKRFLFYEGFDSGLKGDREGWLGILLLVIFALIMIIALVMMLL